MAFIETTLPSTQASVVGSLFREEYPYVGSQIFTVVHNYSQIYSVEVLGVGALSESQYTLISPNKIQINDPLEAADFVVIIYGQANAGVSPYYTQSQTDTLLEVQAEYSEELFITGAKVYARTGITSKGDNFELVVFDVNTATIKAVDSVLFYDELFLPDVEIDEIVRSFPEINYPLSELVTPTGGNVNLNPIITDGLYVRYIGYDLDGNVYSAANSFVDSSVIAQLGVLTVIKTGGIVSFLGGITPGARNVFSIPILASTDDLQRSTTQPSTNVTVAYNTGTPSLKANAGNITGLSINWKGLSNPGNTAPIDKFLYIGTVLMSFASVDPLFLQTTTAPTIHTLWTELEGGVAINNSFFNTTSSLRDSLLATRFGIKRVLIGLKGGFFIQEPQFATNAGYVTIDEAKANIYTHQYTDPIMPPDIVIEVARIIYQQGVTDFSDPSKFFIVATANGIGAGGTVSTVPDATTISKGIIQLAGDLAGTATNPTVPLVRYTNATPTDVTIGGIPAGSTFNNKTMTQMWDALLYPELYPTLVNPSNGFAFNSPGVFEIGSIIPSISFTATFNRGSITPPYTTSGLRSGLPSIYIYTGTSLANTPSTALTDLKNITNYTVISGLNTWTGSVQYSVGEQPLSNKGNPYLSPLPAGTTGAISQSLTGVYPVFYGTSNTPITPDQALINSGVKTVIVSTGTINITFGALTQYIWFAIPQTSTDKTKWFVDALNNGNIGGLSDLFNNDTITAINSPTALWAGISYRIYISNYATTTTGNMQLQN